MLHEHFIKFIITLNIWLTKLFALFGASKMSKNTFIMSYAWGPTFSGLEGALVKLSIILHTCFRNTSELPIFTTKDKISRKRSWLSITSGTYSDIKLKDFIAESWTYWFLSLRRAASSMRDWLTRFCDCYSGSPSRRREKARMLACLYFQFSWWMVLDVKFSILCSNYFESSVNTDSKVEAAPSLIPLASSSSSSTKQRFSKRISTSLSPSCPVIYLFNKGFDSIFFY